MGKGQYSRPKMIEIIKREGGVTFFTVTNKRGEVFDCLIDEVDEYLLDAYSFHTHGHRYISRKLIRNLDVFLHQDIMQTPKGLFTDHINGNGMDNRRCNLRICTAQHNNMNQRIRSDNTSGYKGVSYVDQRRKWQVGIYKDSVRKNLGYFRCPTLAALIYDRKAIELHGEFARLNLPGVLNGS